MIRLVTAVVRFTSPADKSTVDLCSSSGYIILDINVFLYI